MDLFFLTSAAWSSVRVQVFFVLLLWTDASGFSLVYGISLRPCASSEICSDGSCGPCDVTQADQSTTSPEARTHQTHHPVPHVTAPSTKTTLGPEDPASKPSPAQDATSSDSTAGQVAKPKPEETTTTMSSDDTLARPAGVINPRDLPPLSTPVSFGFLYPGEFGQDSTTQSGARDVSTTGSRDTGIMGGGAVPAGWGDFLDMVPAETTEKDSAPNNHKLGLEETTTTRDDDPSPVFADNPASSSSASFSTPASLGDSATRAEAASLARSRVTGSQVLPDDSKKSQGAGPLGAGRSPPHSVDSVSTRAELTTAGRASGGVTVDADWHPADDGSEWSVGGGEEEEESEGGEDEGQLHGVDIVVLVVPCVGALLCVLGAVLVVRLATASCRQRHKLKTETRGRQQQNQRNQQHQQQNELTPTEPEEVYDRIHDHGLY